ncbi:hypothetical protein [Limimaricola cinnabarinus]|uniref:EF-hand domain-containing protein n=1 Tax=Limimaricola cinnabarinus TaxID=1125964 RepID=A0A2G1MIT7_9RHOB|nr:hypothetical protein [Limimaricola cinnabarinus]PHP28653.1 hypothetical protein CJ301_05485 [Limimaricola cinnabarinus]
MTIKLKLLAAAATAALLAGPATAQMFGDEYGTDYDYDTFNTGFGETGYYDALDTDDDTFLNESEYSTGLYADYDRDNDRVISEEEFGLGTERYLGADYESDFATYDADEDGFLDQEEFGEFYGADYTDHYAGLDTDGDELLSEDEYTTGIYDSADLDDDQVVTIEEEGWFEGWFDGDDIEAEIQEVGEVY